MRAGKVKFLNRKTRFGFITENETGREFYVHIKDVVEEITDGDEVEFETEKRKRGEIAIAVRKK